VSRYCAGELAAELGEGFTLLGSEIVEHATPAGNTQQFLYARFGSAPETSAR
jgi:hypothetical protein